MANHYYQQFKEIFTEEGRKNVKIKHIIPGQAPRIACTPGMTRAHQQVRAIFFSIRYLFNNFVLYFFFELFLLNNFFIL